MAMAFRIQVAFAATAALAACAETPQDLEAGTGQVSVPLVTIGGDGAVYALPPGAYLEVYNDTFYDQFSLDGDTQQLSISLPGGDYQVQLSHPSGYQSEWPLLRTDGGGTTTVESALVTPMPVAVTIFPEEVTSLTLSFEVPALGVITFTDGELNVGIGVEIVPTDSVRVTMEGGFIMTGTTVFPAAPEGLATLMPSAGLTSSFSVTVEVPGPWVVASSNTLCAPATVEGWATDDPGFSDFLTEVLRTPQLCLTQDILGEGSAQLVAFRAGTPRTASFASMGSSYSFIFVPTILVGGDFFDGVTFDLNALVGSQVGFSGSLAMSIRGSTGGPRVPWYQGSASWPATFTLTALPE